MKTATITEVKNGLSALIDEVKAGESILITDRGLAVARLEPISMMPDPAGRLRRLERAGIIRTSATGAPLERLRKPASKLAVGMSALDTLLDERRSGR